MSPPAKTPEKNVSWWSRLSAWMTDIFGKVTVRVLSGVAIAYILGWMSNAYIPPLFRKESAHVIAKNYVLRFVPNGGTNATYSLNGKSQTPNAVSASVTIRNESDAQADNCTLTWDDGWWYYASPTADRGKPSSPFSLPPRAERTYSFVTSVGGTEEQFASARMKAHMYVECSNSPRNAYVPE